MRLIIRFLDVLDCRFSLPVFELGMAVAVIFVFLNRSENVLEVFIAVPDANTKLIVKPKNLRPIAFRSFLQVFFIVLSGFFFDRADVRPHVAVIVFELIDSIRNVLRCCLFLSLYH